MKFTTLELLTLRSAIHSQIRENMRYIESIEELFSNDEKIREETKKPFLDDTEVSKELINKINIELRL